MPNGEYETTHLQWHPARYRKKISFKFDTDLSWLIHYISFACYLKRPIFSDTSFTKLDTNARPCRQIFVAD